MNKLKNFIDRIMGNKTRNADAILIAATSKPLNNVVPSASKIPRFIRMKELPQIIDKTAMRIQAIFGLSNVNDGRLAKIMLNL